MAGNGIVVQKYGGSSVADLERLGIVADKVVATHKAGHRVVVVVSAMGKTTDALLGQARAVDPEPPRRELDMLVSTGERVSMALLSIAIQKRGAEAISFTGSQAGILTDERHFDARIVAVRPQRVEDELAKGKIVIVAGYQGVSATTKEITTLGRGGSDTTAVALAAALNAERCEIYSDVDGVYDADPRVVPGAEHLPLLDYETLQVAAEAGAKVLNAQAVEWARRAGIAIYARHTGQAYVGAEPGPGAKQTVVGAAIPADARRARAVVGEKGMALLRYADATAIGAHGTLSALGALGDALSAADLAPRDLSLDGAGCATALFSLLNAPDWTRSRRTLGERLGDAVTIRDGLATATVVGDGLHAVSSPVGGARLAALLAASKATVHAVVIAPLRVSIVVDQEHLDDVVRALHAAVAS
jgi:aspartate kinase